MTESVSLNKRECQLLKKVFEYLESMPEIDGDIKDSSGLHDYDAIKKKLEYKLKGAI